MSEKHQPMRFAVMADDHDDGTMSVSLVDCVKGVRWRAQPDKLPINEGLKQLDLADDLMDRLNHPDKYVLEP